MNTLRLHLHFTPTYLSNRSSSNSPPNFPIKAKSKSPDDVAVTRKRTSPICKRVSVGGVIKAEESKKSRMVMVGAMSVGIAVLLMGIENQRAMALGPEGPLMEEFWDNMRRYALYALTVSTGAIYALLEPILDSLKNPISGILIILILGGGAFFVSQVVTAMVGLTDFSYDYSY